MSLAETPEKTPMPTPPSNATELIWNARQGTPGSGHLVYDSSEAIILALDDTDVFSATASTQHDHSKAARRWAQSQSLTLPDAEAYLLLDGTFERNWSLRIAEKYDRPLSVLDYEINFNDTKWQQYDMSISARADIPGLHGTLRKEMKVQGFASHRPSAADEVQVWTTLTHLETGHEFYENVTESYKVPDAQSYESYPLIPAVLVSIYNNLFADVAEYTELLTDKFTVCERCGMYDESHSAEGLPVMRAIDPNGGWERRYCTACYAQVLTNEYGVLPTLAELYVQRERGATIDELVEAHGASESYIAQMLSRLEDAVKRGDEF